MRVTHKHNQRSLIGGETHSDWDILHSTLDILLHACYQLSLTTGPPHKDLPQAHGAGGRCGIQSSAGVPALAVNILARASINHGELVTPYKMSSRWKNG